MGRFYGTCKFVTVFVTTSHKTLSWVGVIQNPPFHFIQFRYILILSSYPSHILPSGYSKRIFQLFSGLSIYPLLHFFIPNRNIIWRRVTTMKLVVLQFTYTCRNLFPSFERPARRGTQKIESTEACCATPFSCEVAQAFRYFAPSIIPLRFKHFSQQPALKQPQFLFFP